MRKQAMETLIKAEKNELSIFEMVVYTNRVDIHDKMISGKQTDTDYFKYIQAMVEIYHAYRDVKTAVPLPKRYNRLNLRPDMSRLEYYEEMLRYENYKQNSVDMNDKVLSNVRR